MPRKQGPYLSGPQNSQQDNIEDFGGSSACIVQNFLRLESVFNTIQGNLVAKWTSLESGRSPVPTQQQRRTTRNSKDNKRAFQRQGRLAGLGHVWDRSWDQDKSIALPDPGIEPGGLAQTHAQAKQQVILANRSFFQKHLYAPLSLQEG